MDDENRAFILDPEAYVRTLLREREPDRAYFLESREFARRVAYVVFAEAILNDAGTTYN